LLSSGKVDGARVPLPAPHAARRSLSAPHSCFFAGSGRVAVNERLTATVELARATGADAAAARADAAGDDEGDASSSSSEEDLLAQPKEADGAAAGNVQQ